MAELLVKATTYTTGDVEKDRGVYKIGDPVLAMPDGHSWGAEEGLPKFWIVKVTGATVVQLQPYLDAITQPPPPESPTQTPIMLARRKWKVDTVKIPGAVLTQLNTTGTITVTFAQVQSYMTNKVL